MVPLLEGKDGSSFAGGGRDQTGGIALVPAYTWTIASAPLGIQATRCRPSDYLPNSAPVGKDEPMMG